MAIIIQSLIMLGISLRAKSNVKFAFTSGQPNTDHYIDSHFFNVSQK